MSLAISVAALIGALVAFLVVVMLIPLCIPLARRTGLVDRPYDRKRHDGEIPLVGGIAIFIGYSVALLAMGQVELWRGPVFWVWAALMALGLWDDIGHLKVSVRVLFQILAIVLLCSFTGMRLDHLGYLSGDAPVTLGHFALPVTILGLIGIKNGINLIDGLDGLAGTQVLVVLFWFCVLSYQNDIALMVALCTPLAGAVLGFLVYNLRLPGRPARIFLGDHGSVFLGFTLGWFAIVGSQLSIPAFTPIEAVWVLGLPILDTIRVMLSRMLRGSSPFTPGRDHFHHYLVDRGFSVNQTVLILAALSMLFGAVVWLARIAGLSEMLLLCAFLAVSIVFFMGAQSLDRKLHGVERG